MVKTLFDQYLFADYSGGREDRHAQRNISLYSVIADSSARKMFPLTGRAINFSRDTLVAFVASRLSEATSKKERVIFGFDHQYAWPLRLRQHAGIVGKAWRTGIQKLSQGDQSTGLPALDIPKRYCHLFNQFSQQASFWTPFHGVSKLYRISTERPTCEVQSRFRLTELVKPFQGRSRPKPADAVGGTGEGIVGGQTICGLRQIAKMIHRSDIAWWPFDGLDVNSAPYSGKHVGVEIYPSALREGPMQSDDHDASETCLAVRDADKNGKLESLMKLELSYTLEQRVVEEGWIIGMNPNDIEHALKRSSVSNDRSGRDRAMRSSTSDLAEFHCPIDGCEHVFKGSRGGWDSHVASLGNHQQWRQDLRDGGERKNAFKEEFPEFFE